MIFLKMQVLNLRNLYNRIKIYNILNKKRNTLWYLFNSIIKKVNNSNNTL